MIKGAVNSRFQVVVPFSIRSSANTMHDMEAQLDTGFTGALTLPPLVISALGLNWRSQTYSILANGQFHLFDIYNATIIWDGAPQTILVQAADDALLIGLELLKGFDLRVRFNVGGNAEIEAVP
jgi:clan AA aspartic protease